MRQITKAILAALAWVAAGVCTHAAAEMPAHGMTNYRVSLLRSSLGGSNDRGNSINNLGLVSGYSSLPGKAARHATIWLFGRQFDLGTLGGDNSSVPWPVKNGVGLISGIAETGERHPYEETWSCGFFFNTTGNICLGFVWEWGRMRALQPFTGGYNSFATGTNNWGRTVGWAETGLHDPSCDPQSGQVLQFKPAIWDHGSERPRELPLVEGDSSGAATAINDRGQIVGISGACDQAQGRRTATHAVLWENGRVKKIGHIGGDMWTTPMAITERGDIAGFGSTRMGDLDGDSFHAFLKPADGPMRDLGVPAGDTFSVATGINRQRQIVGYAGGATAMHAFIWQNGSLRVLKDLAPDFRGELILAEDINDWGQITGRAKDPDTGALVPFVATPIGGHR